MNDTKIKSVADLSEAVRNQREAWGNDIQPWFRGEPERSSKPLWPKVFRSSHNENLLLQFFRMHAPSFGIDNPPPREHTDEWLFLAQHFGLPTRLLDWTEGLLLALYFALNHTNQARFGSVVWMLNPIELNRKSFKDLPKLRSQILQPLSESPVKREDISFDLPWFSKELNLAAWMRMYEDFERKRGSIDSGENFLSRLRQDSYLPNLANMNVRAAWETSFQGTKLPIALLPSYVHTRMTAQRSRFTIHGRIKSGLKLALGQDVLARVVIDKGRISELKEELSVLGIGPSVVYPDLGGLAQELGERY